MRKIGSALFASVFILVCVLSAASADKLTYYETQDLLSVSVDDCSPGEAYSLLILRGPESNEVSSDTLLDIRQVVAGTAGTLDVAFIGCQFPDCTILAGGSFTGGAASPRLIGKHIAPTTGSAFSMPAQLKTIEESAFENCAFTHVYLGEEVEEIGDYAFRGSTGLVYIYIPKATRIISDTAFSGIEQLVICGYPGSAAETYAIRNHIEFSVYGQ